jgi:hypothetical protein
MPTHRTPRECIGGGPSRRYSKMYLEQLIHIHKSFVNTAFTRLLPFVAEFNNQK